MPKWIFQKTSTDQQGEWSMLNAKFGPGEKSHQPNFALANKIKLTNYHINFYLSKLTLQLV